MKILLQKVLLCILAGFTFQLASAQASWYSSGGNPDYQSKTLVAEKHSIIQIDFEALVSQLSNVPHEDITDIRNSPNVIMLPMPDGRAEAIQIVYSPVMEAELAELYPQIKTFAGIGKDDRNISVRFSISDLGFHAQIFEGNKTSYIDPFDLFDQEFCAIYTRKDYYESYDGELIDCLTDDGPSKLDPTKDRISPVRRPGQDPVVRDDREATVAVAARAANKRYDYSISMTATGEYTQFYGGTVTGATSGIVNSLNRVNGLFGRDLGVRLFLVSNNNYVIYTNPATDPFTSLGVSSLSGANQGVTDSQIGNGNYDVGHIVSASGGGGVVQGRTCNNGNKARGCTALNSPSGDTFNVDYLSHEIGHQFNGSHTFNSECNSQRVSSTAVEPGNGCTIMAYAGVCGTQNFQTFSEDLFHTVSITQITDFVLTGSGNTCDTETNIVNGAPVLESLDIASAPIPENTPFYIAAEFTDPNNDPISYVWEQIDAGPSSSNQSDLDFPSGEQAVFRTYNVSNNGRRDFPRRQELLANAVGWEENLPTYGRRVNLECRVRDNYSVGGCTSKFTTYYDIIDGVGPFAVTSQSAPGLVYASGSALPVSWSVNGTDGTPFFTSAVRISLSLDGGNTFPIVLSSSTPNDGFANVTLPIGTVDNNCRVLIEPLSNHNYYAINTRSFIIEDQRDVRVDAISLGNGAGCSSTISPGLAFTNTGQGTLTSLTAEFFSNGVSVATQNWFGSISPGQTGGWAPGFGPSFSDFPLGYNDLTVQVTLPGGTEVNTFNNSAATSYFRGNLEIDVDVTTDRFGADISWEITNSTGDVVVSGGNYPNQTVTGEYPQPTENYCLIEGCYTFTVFDSFGDALCCSAGEGFIELSSEIGTVLGTTPSEGWTTETSFEFCLEIGCTDPTGCNYDPDANSEGNCDFTCYGCTDEEAYYWEPGATIDDGSCEYDCDGVPVLFTLLTDCFPGETAWAIAGEGDLDFFSVDFGDYTSGETQYEHNLCLQPGCYDFFLSDGFGDGLGGGSSGACDSGNDGYFIMEDEFGNVLFEIDTSNANFGTGVTFTFCIEEGCDDPGSCNYTPDTNGPASLCDYSCLGCTDPLADNFNSGATIDDGSCINPCEVGNVQLEILTDCYPNDLSWVLLDETGVELISFPAGYLTANELNTLDLCLPNGCYNFQLADSFGDGLLGCADSGDFTLIVDGEPIYNLIDEDNVNFGTLLSIPFCVGETCVGDIDGNGIIGINDLLSVSSALGCNSCDDTDIDNNGTTGVSDLLFVVSLLGTVCD